MILKKIECERTHLRQQKVERAPFISDPLVTFTHYIVHVVDRQRKLWSREERGKIRRVEGRQYQIEYPPHGEQNPRRVYNRYKFGIFIR